MFDCFFVKFPVTHCFQKIYKENISWTIDVNFPPNEQGPSFVCDNFELI